MRTSPRKKVVDAALVRLRRKENSYKNGIRKFMKPTGF